MAKKELCDVCGEPLPETMKEQVAHYKMHTNEKKEQAAEEPQTKSMGNEQFNKMIKASKDGFIVIRVVYLDTKPHNSKNGLFLRSVVDPVQNCEFDRTASLFNYPEYRGSERIGGSAVGKRLEAALGEEPDLTKYQFDMKLILNSVNNSRTFVDLDDIEILDETQLPFEKVEEFFPKLGGVKIHRKGK